MVLKEFITFPELNEEEVCFDNGKKSNRLQIINQGYRLKSISAAQDGKFEASCDIEVHTSTKFCLFDLFLCMESISKK